MYGKDFCYQEIINIEKIIIIMMMKWIGVINFKRKHVQP
jgi:hypothetical protein